MRSVSIWILCTLCLGCVMACQTSKTLPQYDGSMLYQGYCASCHGTSGAGDGPVAASLITSLRNLRTLQEHNGGVFPGERVRDAIDGRGLRAAHGTPDMPVWGWEFRRVEESPELADARITALVEYLQSIQN